jgi:hypothetical protein
MPGFGGRLGGRVQFFRWDWMIFPGATIKEQLLLDIFVPLLIVLFYRVPKFYTMAPENDTSEPTWVRNSWKYLLVLLYLWFFSATYYHFFLAVAK